MSTSSRRPGTTQTHGRTGKKAKKNPTDAQERRAKAAAAAAAAAVRRAERRRQVAGWAVGAVALVALAGGLVYLQSRDSGDSSGSGGTTDSAPVVGGDLHTVTATGDTVFVGGHSAVAVSRDEGKTWQDVASLNGADAMGWAITNDAMLVGGHTGLFRSTDNGATFTQGTGDAAVPDVHALGGAGRAVYLASPQAGLLASTDGGQSWRVVNAKVGRSFMGTILVDPKNPDRLIAPDMSGGLSQSSDGGATWQPLGGPMGAMAAAWNPTDTDQIVAVGMNGGARSEDGGGTWQDIQLPTGTSAVSYTADGRTLYAGALDGSQALLYRSTDNGTTWTRTS